jgi:flavin reductase (DIM6/NTAB) family NADH-FMN oxidoreductase RutF
LEFNPFEIGQPATYKLMTGCIVPRPIAWVSTQNCAGQHNLAPFSFFTGISSNPPSLCFAVTFTPFHPTKKKDTLRNILELGEFVVNIVTEKTVLAMNETATDFPEAIDEFRVAELTPIPSKVVKPPRVAESPACFECKLHTTVPIGEGPGSATLIIGLIQHIFVQDDILNERNYVDLQKLQPIGRLAGKEFCHLNDFFTLERKTYQPPS